jgi:hypothetical protein
MSISTSSAWRPERIRRPSISAARTTPRTTIAPTDSQSRCVSFRMSPRSMTSRPVTQMRAICAACEPTASTIERISPARYGLRKPSSRLKVER